MDHHQILLFVFATIVSLAGRLRILAVQLLHLKDLLLHYVWICLHKFLPRRRIVLDRLPKHVAFSVADYYPDDKNYPTVSIQDLAQLIYWCGQYGVEKVSVYDWMGVVAAPSTTRILADSVWSSVGDHHVTLVVNGVVYGKNYEKPSNGHSNKKRILELITLDWRSGRRAIVEASRSFGMDIRSGRRRVDSKSSGLPLNEYLTEQHSISAPDLLIEFGGGQVGDSTCGYPPLALRVVEIVRVPRHRGVDELTFLECLEKYSRRDRRFGK